MGKIKEESIKQLYENEDLCKTIYQNDNIKLGFIPENNSFILYNKEDLNAKLLYKKPTYSKQADIIDENSLAYLAVNNKKKNNSNNMDEEEKRLAKERDYLKFGKDLLNFYENYCKNKEKSNLYLKDEKFKSILAILEDPKMYGILKKSTDKLLDEIYTEDKNINCTTRKEEIKLNTLREEKQEKLEKLEKQEKQIRIQLQQNKEKEQKKELEEFKKQAIIKLQQNKEKENEIQYTNIERNCKNRPQKNKHYNNEQNKKHKISSVQDIDNQSTKRTLSH